MIVTKTAARHWPGAVLTRPAWALTSVAALWGALTVHGWSAWLIAFLLLPDLPLLAGGGTDLERGQLHPRAVPWYNATHHPLPALLAATLSSAALQVGATMPTMAALAWIAHIALDRSLGYGLRTRDGHQRTARPVTAPATPRMEASARTLHSTPASVASSGCGHG